MRGSVPSPIRNGQVRGGRPTVGAVHLIQMVSRGVGVRPVLPCTWVICYRASNVRPRNPSITLANTSLEHGLLLFEAKQSTAYVTKRSLRTHVPYSCLHDRQLLCGICRHRALSVGSFVVATASGPVAGGANAIRPLRKARLHPASDQCPATGGRLCHGADPNAGGGR